jgi:hypothetical protein
MKEIRNRMKTRVMLGLGFKVKEYKGK